MKKTVIVLVLAALAFVMCACGASAKPVESEYNGMTVNDKVQLFIKQRTVTDETGELTLDMENLTDTAYTYDAVQRLEIYDGEKWCIVADRQEAVTMQIFTLSANATDEVSFNLTDHYAKLGEGRYRIVISLVSADGGQTLAAAEFGIGRVEK